MTMLVEHCSVHRSYLLIAFQLTLIVSLTAAYYLQPSHLLKRKLGQSTLYTNETSEDKSSAVAEMAVQIAMLRVPRSTSE